MPAQLGQLSAKPVFSGRLRAEGGSRAGFPSPRTLPVCGWIGDYLYAATGYPGFYSDGLYRYDPTADDWTQQASAPTRRSAAAGDALGGLLYVVGGINPSYLNLNEAYDPGTGTWTAKAPYPLAIRNSAAAVLDGYLYLIGGYDGVDDRPWIYRYDPALNAWERRADAPFLAEAGRAAAFDGRIYYFGGTHGGRLADCAAYDPLTDTWTTMAPMPTARSHMAVGAVADRILVVGGRTATASSGSAVCEAFFPRENRWVQLADWPDSLESPGYAVKDGTLWVISGGSPSGRLAAVRAYVGYIPVLRLGQSRPVRVPILRAPMPSALYDAQTGQAAPHGGRLHGRAGDLLAVVPRGDAEYGLQIVDVELELAWSDEAEPAVPRVSPLVVAQSADLSETEVEWDGWVDTIANDGAADLQFSLDGGVTWHTLQPGEAWSPEWPVVAVAIRFRTAGGTTNFRAWGWRA